MEFALLRGIKRGMYVEFNIDGSLASYLHWDTRSYYLQQAVFCALAGCFGTRAPNVIGQASYSGDELVKLLAALKAKQARLANIEDSNALIRAVTDTAMGMSFLTALTSEQHDLQTEWRTIARLLEAIVEELIELVQKCIMEERVLWVLGI